MMAVYFCNLVWILLASVACVFSAVKEYDNMPERPESFHLEKVDLFNKTFYVGSVHRDWVLQQEKGILDVVNRSLKDKQDNCVAVDVGMNDGFYTHLSAQYGCKVYSFEVQEACIALSRKAVVQNNVSHLTNILRAPVSKVNGERLRFPHGSQEHQARCDGGYSIAGRSHKHFKIEGYHEFNAVSLDGFFTPLMVIDFLKVDVEGFDASVMEGAMVLFQTHRILRAVIEVDARFWLTEDFIASSLKPYARIIKEFGYHIKCATRRRKTSWGAVQDNYSYDDFEKYVRGKNCIDWEFFVPN